MMSKFTSTENPEHFTKALEYLDAHVTSFGILLDYQKLRINAHLHFKFVMDDKVDSDWYKTILSELFKIIRFNF